MGEGEGQPAREAAVVNEAPPAMETLSAREACIRSAATEGDR